MIQLNKDETLSFSEELLLKAGVLTVETLKGKHRLVLNKAVKKR